MFNRPNRILVPVDFSETSVAAVDYAAFMAKTFGARVELLHVADPLISSPAGEAVYVGPERVETVREYGLRIAHEELAKIAERLEKSDINVRYTLAEGAPWECIVAASARADLVVMGTHGRTGFSRVFLGSVTDKVVQRSAAPVLTIRGAVAEPAAETAPVALKTAGATGVS